MFGSKVDIIVVHKTKYSAGGNMKGKNQETGSQSEGYLPSLAKPVQFT